jgi:hypothetical protein
MSDHYVLIGQTPVPIDCDLHTEQGRINFFEWAREFEGMNRVVLQTMVMETVWVSTVFLGLDHSFLRFAHPEAPPILFETMAFWGENGGYEQERCSTWLEAEAQHWAMCREVAKPRSVLAWVGRAWSEYWSEARRDWSEKWRELRGIPPTEIQRLMAQMRRLRV